VDYSLDARDLGDIDDVPVTRFSWTPSMTSSPSGSLRNLVSALTWFRLGDGGGGAAREGSGMTTTMMMMTVMMMMMMMIVTSPADGGGDEPGEAEQRVDEGQHRHPQQVLRPPTPQSQPQPQE
jgi:hypothetical protein